MRVLIIAIGSTGDVKPMILFGKELMSRGHDVSVVAFSVFQQSIESAGMRHFSLPGDAKAYIGSILKPGASAFTFLSRFMATFNHQLIPLLDVVYRACQNQGAIVSTFMGDVPQILANHFRIPFAEVCFCPMYPTKDHCLPIVGIHSVSKGINMASYRAAYALIHLTEKKYANQWFMQNGMNLCSYFGNTRPILNAYSPCMCERPKEWPENVRITGFFDEAEPAYSPSGELLSFLEESPIYIGFGSMTSGDFQRTMPIVQSALRKLGMRAVLSAGWGGLNAFHSDNILMLNEYVPHRWLFHHVRAVIHHGGAGTTYAGLREGKPTLIIPFGSDQLFWGARVHQMGCGPRPLPFKKITEKRLIQRLSALSRATYQNSAEQIKRQLEKENGLREAADIFEEHLRQNEATQP